MTVAYERLPKAGADMFGWAGRIAVELDEVTGDVVVHLAGLPIRLHKLPANSTQVYPQCVKCRQVLYPLSRRGADGQPVHVHKVHSEGRTELYTKCPDRFEGEVAVAQSLAGQVMVQFPTEGDAEILEVDNGWFWVLPREEEPRPPLRVLPDAVN